MRAWGTLEKRQPQVKKSQSGICINLNRLPELCNPLGGEALKKG